MSENNTLKESIEKAANESGKEIENSNTQKENPESDKETTDSTNDEKDEETSPTEDETDHEQNEEVETGVALLRALRDPKQAKTVVQDLAIRLGLVNQGEKVSTSDAKDIKAVLKEVLADDYPDLREKLEVVLGKVQEDQDNKLRELESKVSEAERIRNEREFMGTYDKFLKDNKIDDNMAGKMIREMQLIPPGPKISLVQYLNKIHSLVQSSTDAAKNSVKRAERINSNLKDSTVKNLSSDVSDSRISKGSHRPSIKEAISMALDEQRK